MSTVGLRLPESLHTRVRAVAEREGVSINQLITTALAEKLSVLLTADYRTERAARGSREQFLRALAQAPDVPPDAADGRGGGRSRAPAVWRNVGAVGTG